MATNTAFAIKGNWVFFRISCSEVENETNITFVVYAVNERGNPYELSCTTKIEIPEKIAPDLGYLEVYGGRGYNSYDGMYAPHQSTGYYRSNF